MKAVILAGGIGSRLSEETSSKPKPMVEIGGLPILWHIMKMYSQYDINEFIICLGYKGYLIKEYFTNYFLHRSDITVDMKDNTTTIHENFSEPWKVTLVDTGQETMTGGRLLRIKNYLGAENFCFTYGDGIADIDINQLIEFHNNQNCKATVTTVQPPGRFGSIQIENGKVNSFQEKPKGDGGWINGGFFILSPSVLDEITGDETVWEQEPLISLAKKGELASFKHEGFWYAMDTLRDKTHLNSLWDNNSAPWKKW